MNRRIGVSFFIGPWFFLALLLAGCNYVSSTEPTATSLPFWPQATQTPTYPLFVALQTSEPKALEPISIDNIERLKPVMRVQDDSGISHIAFSPDGNLLAVGSAKPIVHIWSVREASLAATLTGHQGSVPAVAFSPDGQVLATGSWDRTIRLWRVEDWSLITSWTAHEGYVRTLAFSPDGALLASGGEDNAVNVWTPDGSRQLYHLLGSGISVNEIVFSPDSSLLVSAYGDSKARVWSMADGTLLRSLTGFSNTSSLAFNLEGSLLAGGSWSYSPDTLKPLGRIAFWNPTSGDRLYGTDLNTGALAIVFSTDGSLLFSTTTDDEEYRLRVWRVSDGKWVKDWGGIADRPYALDRNPDGTILATGASDGEILFWSIE